jgi:hypothetical protein
VSKYIVIPLKGDLEGSNIESSYSRVALGLVNIGLAKIYSESTNTVYNLEITTNDSSKFSYKSRGICTNNA